GPAVAAAIKTARPDDGARVLERLAVLGARVLVAGEAEFPAQLTEIPDSPAVLYVWGDLSLLTRPAVAMVGSRNHTSYGAEAARVLAGAVAQRAVIVSGMARGIDAIVHTAALDAGGRSVGVLGNGFGFVYPGLGLPLWNRMTHVPEHVDELVRLARRKPAAVCGPLRGVELGGWCGRGRGWCSGSPDGNAERGMRNAEFHCSPYALNCIR